MCRASVSLRSPSHKPIHRKGVPGWAYSGVWRQKCYWGISKHTLKNSKTYALGWFSIFHYPHPLGKKIQSKKILLSTLLKTSILAYRHLSCTVAWRVQEMRPHKTREASLTCMWLWVWESPCTNRQWQETLMQLTGCQHGPRVLWQGCVPPHQALTQFGTWALGPSLHRARETSEWAEGTGTWTAGLRTAPLLPSVEALPAH